MTTGAPDEHARPGPEGEAEGERTRSQSADTAPPKPATGSFRSRPESERIGLALRGALRCVVCKYDLQGLSVRSVCPECGTAVRATILMAVDPKAEALAPMHAPRLVAAGLITCSGAGLLAIVLCWLPRIAELVARAGVVVPTSIGSPGWLPEAIAGLAALSGLGALSLVRPMRAIPPAATLAALGGVAGYALVAWGLWKIHGPIDRGAAWPYFAGPPSPERLLHRSVVAMGLIVALTGLRPNARRLVHRSLALRTGRVDRQTLLAMVGAVALSSAGDGVRLLSLSVGTAGAELVDDLGTLMVAIGSMFFTVGAASALVDSVRIGRAIVTPMPSLRSVIEGNS